MCEEIIVEEPVNKNFKLTDVENYVDDSTADELNFDENDTPIIENKNQAEYFVAQYKKAIQSIEENESAFKEYVDWQTKKAEQWLESINKEHKFIVEKVGLLLEDYARKNIKAEDKKKSIKLINSMLGLRSQKPEYDYDEDEVREFLEINDSSILVPQKPKIDKVALKQKGVIDGENLKINGKIVPSLVVKPKGDAFYIK